MEYFFKDLNSADFFSVIIFFFGISFSKGHFLFVICMIFLLPNSLYFKNVIHLFLFFFFINVLKNYSYNLFSNFFDYNSSVSKIFFLKRNK